MAKRVKNKGRTLFEKDGENLQDILDFCAATNKPYKVIEGNYITTIESNFCNITFMHEQKGKRAFIAGNMIKRDIANTGLIPPNIDPEDLIYFNFTVPEKLRNTVSTVYNIDIKSAYANILKNHSLITPKTYAYLCSLSKPDRLACVGMLATKKEVYTMLGYNTQDYEQILLDTRNWFFFCVQRTNEIIQECKRTIGNSFLFYWVDGIFFDKETDAKRIGEILQIKGYKYSFDICTNFEYSETDNKKIIRYKKEGKSKMLYLPKKNESIDEFLVKFLKFHNYKKYNNVVKN